MQDEKRFAVLIDADNVSAKYIKSILDEISNYGVATYKRIYGDWTRPNTSSWKDLLLENSITPVQQYGYTVGKNATDSAMIIDAMDILYSSNVEGFCIVSSDSDFTKLASRLRESGMLVVGMGEKKTPKPFIAACNQFKFLDIIAETEQKDDKALNIESKAEDRNIDQNSKAESSSDNNSDSNKTMTDINVIKSTVIKMMNEVDEGTSRMNMGELGSRLVKRYPDFDVRNYGDTKLSKFLKKIDVLEITTDGRESSSMWVSLKSDKDQDNIEKAPAPRNKQKYKRNYKKK
ncbi:MAG TPA: NYN domain-containing protein [Clostridiales bacterium]|nr:NYN domain-containing protein [Clostridiales bacterium]